jgi:hypothetical protein
MCLALYVGSDAELPDLDTEHIVVRSLSPSEQRVARQFSKPNIAYVGAFTGCGCGWTVSYGDPAQERQRRASIEALLSFLELHARDETLELFVCWSGAEASAQQRRGRLMDRKDLADLVQYFAVSRIAARTSAELGRISSSRSGQ